MKKMIVFNPTKYQMKTSLASYSNVIAFTDLPDKLVYIPEEFTQLFLDDIKRAMEGLPPKKILGTILGFPVVEDPNLKSPEITLGDFSHYIKRVKK